MAFKMIDHLSARESLELITATSFPHSKKESREKLHRTLHKRANPKVHDEFSEKKVFKTVDVVRLLNG